VVVAFVVGVVVTRFSTAGEAMTEAAVARKRMEKMFFMMANSKTGVEMLGDGTGTIPLLAWACMTFIRAPSKALQHLHAC
jgi:hypothetical protein